MPSFFRCREGPLRETNRHIDEYALEGLRTLAIGSRELSDSDLAQFEAQLFEAQQALEGREAKTQVLYFRECEPSSSQNIRGAKEMGGGYYQSRY
jgi:hypothetical protein